MFTKIGLIIAVAVGLLAALQRWQPATPKEPQQLVSGRNNTALFFVNEHPGLSNVHAATAQSLLEHYPEIQVHFASFPKLEKTLARVSSFAKRHEQDAKDVVFHNLSGPSYYEAIRTHSIVAPNEDGKISAITKPGTEGIRVVTDHMQIYLSPWTHEGHLAHFQQIGELIDKVDPAVVVLDTIFMPAIEATRARNRLHAFITPNILVDNFIGQQPWLGMLWKYPAVNSGFPFPVPFRLILQNIYFNIYLISKVLRLPDIKLKRSFLEVNGVPDPINFYGLHRTDTPFITQTTHAATIPVDYVPENVTCAGPITLFAAPAEEQDPELMQWIKQGKTILINLGSGFKYSKTYTRQMTEAIRQIAETTDLQILWKYAPSPDIVFDWQAVIEVLNTTGRVKVVTWLSIDPASLMESGYITTFVTHGGANGFHESIAAGVPQVVLPLWVDLYAYAQLAQQTGVGIWGCRDTSPDWTPECLRDDILKVALGPESVNYRTKARQVSAAAMEQGLGRDISASVIAQLARSGQR